MLGRQCHALANKVYSCVIIHIKILHYADRHAKGLLYNIIQEIYACCFIYLIQKYIYTLPLYMILYTKNGGADFAYNQQKSSFQFN